MTVAAFTTPEARLIIRGDETTEAGAFRRSGGFLFLAIEKTDRSWSASGTYQQRGSAAMAAGVRWAD